MPKRVSTGRSRGFFAIGLQNCKSGMNLGSVMRLATNHRASFVAVEGKRIRPGVTDTFATYRHKPLLYGSLLDFIPHDCVPVAVEMTSNARDIREYTHPESAFYIFGPEDGSIRRETLEKCRDVLYVPTELCLNLAVCVATVLYDRALKQKWRELSLSESA